MITWIFFSKATLVNSPVKQGDGAKIRVTVQQPASSASNYMVVLTGNAGKCFCNSTGLSFHVGTYLSEYYNCLSPFNAVGMKECKEPLVNGQSSHETTLFPFTYTNRSRTCKYRILRLRLDRKNAEEKRRRLHGHQRVDGGLWGLGQPQQRRHQRDV